MASPPLLAQVDDTDELDELGNSEVAAELDELCELDELNEFIARYISLRTTPPPNAVASPPWLTAIIVLPLVSAILTSGGIPSG